MSLYDMCGHAHCKVFFILFNKYWLQPSWIDSVIGEPTQYPSTRISV